MPTLTDFRADFRKGRTGSGLRIRQDAQAYTSSVREANNMMVLGDGRIGRRWGTKYLKGFSSGIRIEPWYYSNTEQYLIVFKPLEEEIEIHTYTPSTDALTIVIRYSGQSWLTTSNVDYISIASEGDSLILADATFNTKIIRRRADGTFALNNFEFGINLQTGGMQAPFYQFASDTLEITANIWTAAGASTGYQSYLSSVQQITSSVQAADLAAGTGTIVSNEDLFTADHVNSRMKLLDGEYEITSVIGPREARVTVKADVVKRMDTDPFYMKKNSKLVEVSFFNHGLSVGDKVFFAGLSASDNARLTLNQSPLAAGTSSSSTAGSGGTAFYTITRILNLDTFEIQTNGSNATNDVLAGGTGIMCFVLSGTKGVKEPAFSDARGWPTTCAVHERRLWMAGTNSLANAAWGSQFGQFRNFDLGTGQAAEAIALYGIGQQSRIRHVIAAYDLMFFTDSDEIYVPGSTTEAISQGSVRIVSATEHGASYTQPHKFDGGVFYVDFNGLVIREFTSDSRITEYSSLPASIIVPDWVKEPKDAAVFDGGSALITTPYMLFANQTDGAMLVLHSSRADDSFGWMRWTLDNGSFTSVATLGTRLFAVGKRQINLDANGTSSGVDEYVILRFDSESENYITTDFSEVLTNGSATTSWTASNINGRVQQAYYGYYTYANVSVAASTKAFTNDTSVTSVTIGDPMSWNVEFHAPVASMQTGTRIGQQQRLVSATISWEKAATGKIQGVDVLTGLDIAEDLAVIPVDDWREYYIGLWGRDPTLKITGNTAGRLVMRGAVLNVYV